MLVADNEFGAPWNDQFYKVRMISIEEAIPDVVEEVLTLSGPKEYDEDELYEEAKNMFPNYLILSIHAIHRFKRRNYRTRTRSPWNI